MTRVAASVARRKEHHPEQYCRAPRCLWYVGPEPVGILHHSWTGYCPRHAPKGKA
jgi:hypothetical protein